VRERERGGREKKRETKRDKKGMWEIKREREKERE